MPETIRGISGEIVLWLRLEFLLLVIPTGSWTFLTRGTSSITVFSLPLNIFDCDVPLLSSAVLPMRKSLLPVIYLV